MLMVIHTTLQTFQSSIPAMKIVKPSLVLCLLLDAIGYFTYAIPFLGEFGDIIWAPVSGLIFYRLFGGWKGALGGLFSFAEEILPFTDFIPTFTIAWFAKQYAGSRKAPLSGSPNRLP
jgi:hypothetical protein